ncbi:hypothetical protein BH18ACI5_BH18ACI5_04390 [soil metagenome]
MRSLVDPCLRKWLCAEHWALLRSTLEMLIEADLEDVVRTLTTNAVGPDCRLPRVMVIGPDELTPYMQLLIHELRWIATAPGWSLRLRREQANDALRYCGFDEETWRFWCRYEGDEK